MAETSRSNITITLGRTGQVVRKAGLVTERNASDSITSRGMKRSVRDRLGSNVSHPSGLNRKRFRGSDGIQSNKDISNLHDSLIGKDDLRFKLMRKNVNKRTQNDLQPNNADLREKLSRMARPPMTSSDAQENFPRRLDPSLFRHHIPPASAHNSPQIHRARNSYSGWTYDQLRKQPTERELHVSSGVISSHSTRNAVGGQKSFLDNIGPVSYTAKDSGNSLRPISSTTVVAKSAVPSGSKSAAPARTVLFPLVSVLQSGSYTGDEQLTVDSLLQSLGLKKYSILFKAEEVDMAALKQMGDTDLKELGIPMGPRKKILLALTSRTRAQL